MAKAPNILPLKMLVISLGFVLIGGTVFVAAALVGKASKLPATCKDVTISLSSVHEKGTLTSMTAHDNIVHLVFSDSPNNTIVTVNRCTGAVQQRFILTP